MGSNFLEEWRHLARLSMRPTPTSLACSSSGPPRPTYLARPGAFCKGLRWNWSLEAEHTFAKDYTFTARYVGTRGVHQLIQQQIDRLHSLVTPTSFIPTYLTAPSASTLASLPLNVGNLREPSTWADPAWAAAGFDKAITSYQPQGWSLRQRPGSAIAAALRARSAVPRRSATWSHNIDNQTATLNTSALEPAALSRISATSLRKKAASALDRRQRLTFFGGLGPAVP